MTATAEGILFALMGLAPLGAVSGPTLTAFVLAGGAMLVW